MWKLFVLGCLFFPGIVFGEKKKFTINGAIPEMPEGKMIVVSQEVGRVDTLGQGDIVSGKFVIEGELDEPRVALIYVAGYGGGFVFILDTDAPYEMELFQSGKSVIRGGKLQKELNVYQEAVTEENQKIRKVKMELEEASAAKHFRTVNELKVKLEQLTAEAQKRLGVILERNKDNVLAAYVQTAGMERMDLNGLKMCYAGLSDKAKHTGPGKLMAARIRALEGVEVDAVAPNFTLPTPEGKEIALYEVKGKLKIIDFWASWCGPCRMENPNMVKLYNDFKEKGLVVVSVSLDEKKDKWEEAIKKDGLTWLHLSDLKGWQGDVVKMYNIDAVPTILVLDENNRIIAKNLRGEKLRALVSERLE
ncbi:TlpA disulfide reductase family protein [Butyricimonas sp.]|uniref:TlpA disulfide reductase family protein n=1 Tax=Butyricimonas sp. TaxID=1969738 RepID=UPI0025C51C57|nr:TlpA disulfide reductase family protein [Butyricimonas sp.]MDY4044413.1 TlpA disulfide reductase family protein [Marinifilaceae bacterium]